MAALHLHDVGKIGIPDHILLKPAVLTKEEWEVRRAEIDLASYAVSQEMLKKFYAMIADTVWPENFNDQAENSTGEYLTKVYNNNFGFANINGAHDLYWTNYATGNSYDGVFCSGMFDANTCYYATSSSQSSHIQFSYHCVSSQNLEYCIDCYNCENCFGCVGLNRKQFCILNKQYIEEDYWKKLDELKCHMLERGEYGEFFPLSMATSRMLWFPVCFSVVSI